MKNISYMKFNGAPLAILNVSCDVMESCWDSEVVMRLRLTLAVKVYDYESLDETS